VFSFDVLPYFQKTPKDGFALKHVVFMVTMCDIQNDRKVTQLILKYLLMVAIQYNSTEFLNTQYRCDYTRAHAGHVML
jgi:hypothetical protein